MNFDAFVKDIEDNNWNVFGVEVYKHNQLLYSYGDVMGIHELYSATKTILSIAVGIAMDRGVIDLDSPVAAYLPKERIDRLPKKQQRSWQMITLRRLLTMSVDGLVFRPEGDSWLDFSLGCNIENPHMEIFNYNNICAYLTGVALTEALGEDLGNYIVKNIFEPMGIREYEFGRCPEGYFYGASQMKMSVHDLSKIGLMLMNKGIYNGRRIVSEQYIDMATSVQQDCKEGGYGFYMWKYRDGFSINGKWKQKCYCLPESDMIITYLSHIEDETCPLRQSMEKWILDLE